MITKYIEGDITETELKYIAHGVNCQNVMGSGVAKALFTKWPEVKTQYHKFCTRKSLHYKPHNLLGMVDYVFIEKDKKGIFNCFTQENFGYDGQRYVNYAAVADCLAYIAETLDDTDDKRLAIPKIGCGLAGGNWTFMEQLINDTVSDRIEIWVYEMNTTKASGKNDFA